MRNYLLLCLLLTSSLLCALSLDPGQPSRNTVISSCADDGNIYLPISNYGFFGACDISDSSMEWPCDSGNSYLYVGAPWIGAKLQRRNDAGIKLYWYDVSHYQTIAENDPNWLPTMTPVIDTLTTTGYDGDLDLYEFLPAYNTLEEYYLDQYVTYNESDQVLHSLFSLKDTDDDNDGAVDEDNLGRPWALPDPQGSYCFTIPSDEDGDGLCDEDISMPGIENTVAYYYDYSPFGTERERHLGNTAYVSYHYPLYLAVRQETYAWPVGDFADMVFFHNTLCNRNVADTLYDFAYGYYIDADCHSSDGGNTSDVSSYYSGNGVSFAYSYNKIGDVPGYLGFMLLNRGNANQDCWTWQIGHGPDDSDPLYLPAHGTANEKYWLMTGRNPNTQDFSSLRDNPDTQVNNPCDTRFLLSIYGDQAGLHPTSASLDLAPGASADFYGVMIMGNSLDELIVKAEEANQFYQSGFDPAYYQNDTAAPQLTSAVVDTQHNVTLTYHAVVSVDSVYVCFKPAEASAREWVYQPVNPTLTTYSVTGLGSGDYKFKIATVKGTVYLESKTLIVNLNQVSYPTPHLALMQNPALPRALEIAVNIEGTPTGVSLKLNNQPATLTALNGNSYVGNWIMDSDGTATLVLTVSSAVGDTVLTRSFSVLHNRSDGARGSSADGLLTMSIPSGALPVDTYCALIPEDETYQIGTSSLTLSHPATLSWLSQQSDQAIYLEENGTWHELPSRYEHGNIVAELPAFGKVRLDSRTVDAPVSRLLGNFPNPFNPTTSIRFELGGYTAHVRLEIYNIKGQRVNCLLDGPLDAGTHQVNWNGTDSQGRTVSSGVYFYRLTTGHDQQTHRMLLMK